MKFVAAVFNKTLVLKFYQDNASFFLLVVGLAGGFMRSVDHLALAEFFISTPLLLSIPILVWTGYAAKCINFNLQALQKTENEFLYYGSLLEPRILWPALLQVIIVQMAPAIAYSIFLLLLALRYGFILSIVMIVSSPVILLAVSTQRIYYALHHPNQERRTNALSKLLNHSFTRPLLSFFFEWIIRQRLMLVLGTKFFSAVMLMGILHLYYADVYDDRLLMLGALLAAAGHAQILWELHQFDNLHFALLRQMPFSFGKRFLYNGITLFILLFIEIGLLINYRPDYLSYATMLLATGWMFSILTIFSCTLYVKDRYQEEIMPLVFAYCIAMFVLILFAIPAVLLIVLNVAAGFLIWRRNYYAFEYVSR